MTELEFIQSLPQSLTEEQKLEKLNEWRANNPQPEVEEDVEETVEETEEGTEEIEEVEEAEDTYIPFSVLAGDTPGLSNKVAGFGTKEFGTKVLNTMSAYDNYFKTEPKFNQVVKMGETHTADGYDYKAETQGTSLVYYTKKEGADDWIKLDPNDIAAIGVAAELKHVDFDMEAYYASKNEADKQAKQQLQKYNDYNVQIEEQKNEGIFNPTVEVTEEEAIGTAEDVTQERIAFEQREETIIKGDLGENVDGEAVVNFIENIPEESEIELTASDFGGNQIKADVANGLRDIKTRGWQLGKPRANKKTVFNLPTGEKITFDWKGNIEKKPEVLDLDTAAEYKDKHILQKPVWVHAGFNSKTEYEDSVKEEAGFIKKRNWKGDYWAPPTGLQNEAKAKKKLKEIEARYKEPWSTERTDYLDNIKEEYKETHAKRDELIKEWDKEAGVVRKNFWGTKMKEVTVDKPNPKYVEHFSKNFLPDGFGDIEEGAMVIGSDGEETGETQLEEAMRLSIGKAIDEDPVIQKQYLDLQIKAKPLIEKKQEELRDKYDLSTEEGNAAATEELQQYAKSITQDKLVESTEFRERVESIQTAADASFSSTNKNAGRFKDDFFRTMDIMSAVGFEKTAAALEGFAKGSKAIQSGFNKMQVGWEQQWVESADKNLKAINDVIKKGELDPEEMVDVNGRKMKAKDAIKFWEKRKENATESVQEQLDDVYQITKDMELYKEADLDRMSITDMIFTTAEALPQIGLAVGGTALGMATGGTGFGILAPLLTGLGTATMFTQMYGDAYYDALESGVQADAEQRGINWGSLSEKEQNSLILQGLESGQYADQSTAAATAGVQVLMERFGAGKILKTTTKAIGLGTKGTFSLFNNQWKQGGKQLLHSMLAKAESGLTEFGTEWSQEILGQLGKAAQHGSPNAFKYTDFDSAWTSGKAGGIVGVILPLGGGIVTQATQEVRSLSRKIAINFAPDSKFGQASMVAEAQFKANQKALDQMLKNNTIDKEQHAEDSQALADIENAYRKTPSNVDPTSRAKIIDLMIKRDGLERKIKKIDDKDLTEQEQAELDETKTELKEVIREENLWKKTGGVKAAIIEVGSKAGKDIEIQDFENSQEMNEWAAEKELEGYEKKNSAAHGVILTNPKTGAETILINNDLSLDPNKGNVNVAGHEFLHSVLKKTIEASPETAEIISNKLTTYLEKLDPSNVDPESNYGKRIQAYKDSPTEITAEEKITLLSDALVNGDIKYNENIFTKIGDVIRRTLQAAGLRDIKFKTGKDVFNFVRDYNASMEKDAKLNTAQEKMMIEGAEVDFNKAVETIKAIDNRLNTDNITADTTFEQWRDDQTGPKDNKADSSVFDENRTGLENSFNIIKENILGLAADALTLGTKKKMKGKPKGKVKESKSTDYIVAPETEAYMEVENDVLQQGLVSAIKNKTAQQFPIAQAIVEKNWGLISPKLNINNEAEMIAAKELVIDQLLGKVEATQDKKYGPRNTSILEGFSLDPEAGVYGAQVSTYLTKAITTRKPEIDAAIADRTQRTGRDLDQAKEKIADKTRKEKPTKKISPKELKQYPITTLENLGVETKEGVDAIIETAIEEDLKSGETIAKTFGKTRAGTKLANVLGKMFGLNPQIFTDKTRNIQKKELGGLRNLRQFLDNNAQKDFNLLPDAYNPDGKSTFIPNNVLNALYTKDKDGKWKKDKSKTLTDYKNLLGDIDGAVYRAAEAQTLKGLAEISFRNLIIEQAASKLEGKAKVDLKGGAKFSKIVELNPNQKTALADVMQAKDINQVAQDANIKGDITVTKKNRAERIISVLKSIAKGKLPGPIIKLSGLTNFGRSTRYGKIVKGKLVVLAKKNGGIKHFETKDGWVKQNSKGYKQATQNGTFIPARGSLYYGQNDPNYIEAMELANANNDLYAPSVIENMDNVKRVRVPKGKKLTTADKKAREAQEKINMKALDDYVSILNTAVNENKMPINDAALLVTAAYQGTNSLIKIAAPFVGSSKVFSRAKSGKQTGWVNTYVEEHSPPASAVGAAIIWGLKNDAIIPIMKGVKANFVQVQLATSADRKIDLAKLDKTLPEGISIVTPNAGYIRLAAAGINLNNITDLKTGKPVAEVLGLGLNTIEARNPSAVHYQNELIQAVAKGSLKKSDAKKRLEIIKPIAQDKNKSVKWNSKNLAPTILSPTNTSFESKSVMLNSQETAAKAQKINKPKKGISVFDMDDTLAITKEEVLVSMPDGTLRRLSPAQFAAQAQTLQEQGAEFDFSQFEDVKGAKKGPLADLALKRQGKFGSGDIYVLTARPQISAQGIKTFLDGIGLNIPIENIIGLEDGSPQAKADWVLAKTAQGYNDFYFADDSKMNVDAVQQVLNQVDVKSDVQQAKESKAVELDKQINTIIEESTGLKEEAEYSDTRAKLEGKKKDKGLLNWFKKQLTITPSAEDFMGLMYDLLGRGKQGSQHAVWIKKNLMDPYNKAEQLILSAKTTVATDFANLKKQFPSLKSKNGNNPLMDLIKIGPYTKSHAVRVYLWAKQGLDIPGISKRDQKALIKAVESDNELNVFADEIALIQKDAKYPPPTLNWAGGDIATDITNSLEKTLRKQAMTEFNDNVDIIFSEKVKNKLRAIHGNKWVEALEDSIRRMKSGSNRPVYQGGGSRVVNELLDWLNGSVGAIMFVNMRSGLLQLISNINFINWGDNNILAAAKAFASKDYFPTVIKLMNSDYLVNRRDGLKINVNEAELANAAKQGGMKGMIAYLLNKGFIITRIMDSLAIATGGATFYMNRKAALLKRINKETGKLYTEAEAETQAFEDFYAIAEESQQSSNPSKISQQQASLAGRVILSFQNVTMQYNRMTKKAIRDLYNRRKRPGQTQREADLSNISKIVYYVGVQNAIFHSLQNTLFAALFDDEEDEETKNKTAKVANGMVDSLLFGLGFGGAAISTVKNVLLKIGSEHGKKSPKYEEAVWSLFDFSPVLDSKVRKMRSGLKTFSWNKEEIRKRGWSLDNPAYLAITQMISAGTNIPLDRVLRKTMNIRAAMDEETRTWQRVSLLLGWDTYSVGLPYWGLQSTIKKEQEDRAKAKEQYKWDIKKLKRQGYKKGKDNGTDVIEVEHFSGIIQYWSK